MKSATGVDKEGKPLVSIVTPSFNQAKFLRDSLTSVRRQAYPCIEHLVTDGGSDDGTIEILESADDRSRLDWISEPDEGHWDALNKGFERAEGELVGWLNSDDAYLFSDTISKVVQAFKTRPEADVLYGHALTIDSKNRVLEAKRTRSFSYQKLLQGCFLVQPAVFFRKHVVKQEQLRPGIEYALDYEYWLRLARKFDLRRIDEFLAADRLHRDRKSTEGAEIQREQSESIRAEYGYDGSRAWGDIPLTDRILSSIPRRLYGMKDLISLRSRQDVAVDLEWGSWPALLHRQIVRPLASL